MQSLDITILNGLPVTVAFDIEPADPEVGYMHDYIESWEITHLNGRHVKSADFLMKRIDAKENDRIMELCYNSISN